MYPVLSNTFRSQRNLLDTLFGDEFFNVGANRIVIDDVGRVNIKKLIPKQGVEQVPLGAESVT